MRRARTLDRMPRGDERGSTLILALVLIIIVAVAGTAVIRQAGSAPAAQATYTGLRTAELNLDGGVDTLTKTLQGDPLSGLPGSANMCSNTSGWGSAIGPNITANGKTYELHCQADVTSNQPQGASGDVPDNSILTLGGMRTTGTLYDPAWTTTPPNYRPFCDDFHNFQGSGGNGGGRCEAGLFIGKNTTTTDTSAGGLYIADNDSAHTTTPIVATNGSIVVSDNGGIPRTLKVEGPRPAWARRYCGWGSGYTSAGYTLPNINNYILAGYQQDGSQDTTLRQCAQGLDPSAGSGHNAEPLADPDFLPEPINPYTVPKIDASQVNVNYRLTPSICSGNKGLVVMPAMKTGTQQVPGGSAYPVYAGWYDSATDLDAVMNDPSCAGQLLWFRPGVYYFDFLDVGSADKWLATPGCIPEDACGKRPSEVFGGMPVYDWGWSGAWDPAYPATTAPRGGANFCITNQYGMTSLASDYTQTGINNNIAKCVQPPRVMVPQSNVGVNNNDWDSGQADVPHAATLDGTPATATMIGSSHQDTELVSDQLQMTIPEANATVNSVVLEIPYKLQDDPNFVGATYTDPSIDQYNLGRGADVEIRTAHGSCWLRLPADNTDHLGIAPGTDGLNHATDAVARFDITQGCNRQVLSGRILKVSTGSNQFPTGPTSWTSGIGPLPDGNTLAAHPDWINQMQIHIHVHVPANINTSYFKVDGAQVTVQWTGPPQPTFPHGCDRTLPGIQWIFGGTARIDWGNQGNNSMYAELCGNRRDQYLGTAAYSTAQHAACDTCNIAIYGMTEDAAGSPDYISTEPTSADQTPFRPDQTAANGKLHHWDPSGLTGLTEIAAPAGLQNYFSSASAWGTGTPPIPADYVKDHDGLSAIARDPVNWKPGNTNAAALSFKLPSGAVCAATNSALLASPTSSCDMTHQIPAGSQITNVMVKIRHREGWVDNGGTLHTSCPDPNPCIAKVKLVFDPEPNDVSGSSIPSSNGYSGSFWSSASVYPTGWVQGTPSSNSPDIPICDSASAAAAADGGFCTDTWGDASDTSFPAWDMQRNLTDALASPEAFNNLEVTYSVTPRDVTNTTKFPGAVSHYAELDKLALIVQFRPPTSPRPLAGCITSRLGTFTKNAAGDIMNNPDFEGSGPVDGSGNPVPNAYGRTIYYNNGGHDWLDGDYAINAQSRAQAFIGDDSFGNYSTGDGKGAGNGPTLRSCPLLEVTSANGSTPVIKFHVEGTVYAPNAAFEFSGNDNDASWVSDGIVARHLSALRWKNASGDLPAVGGAFSARSDRIINFALCIVGSNCVGTGAIALTARIEYHDWDPALRTDVPNPTVSILSWTRNAQ